MSQTIRCIVGVDEAGRGALAGPLVAAALVISDEKLFPRESVKDSKLLSDARRRELFPQIQKSCAVCFGIVSHRYIDQHGIQAANVFAMDLALQQFLWGDYDIHSDYVASFASLTSLPISISLHIRGESVLPEIAAASIMAKVYRDNLMIAFAKQFSGYDFHVHKGYGTEEHRRALHKNGASAIHRKSFRPLAK